MSERDYIRILSRWGNFVEDRQFLESKCGSPIELNLGMAMVTLWNLSPNCSCIIPVSSSPDHIKTETISGDFDREREIYIFPQYAIGKYTADFLIVPRRRVFVLNNDVESAKMKVLPHVVVECDGHDFHEKTKEQASHDKRRDRSMTCKGLRVVRFTGSEIHRDAMGCALEVDSAIDSLEESIEEECSL